MSSLTGLEQFVRALEESAQHKAPGPAHAETLTRTIVAADYATAEERYAAQALVIRLYRLGRTDTRRGRQNRPRPSPVGVAPAPGAQRR
jgi:hypothetical protein